LIFESGAVLTLNKTSSRILIRAYGKDAREWVGKTIKAYAGQVPFKDGMTDAALVETISPPTSDGKLPPPQPKASNEFEDEIPF
jgi:actin-like ATPase involved in cell morphogenesis